LPEQLHQWGTHDVLYVATEHASLYAFDADTGGVWHITLLANGETPSDNRGCSQITPEIGITSSPVIDRTAGTNGIIYAVAMSKNAAGTYFQRLPHHRSGTFRRTDNRPSFVPGNWR
jgi:outer membrane protein assembly factor BamB